MSNKFIVSTCRFHTKKANTLLIVGCFEENDIADSKLIVQLDNTLLAIETEEKERLMVNQRSATGKYISKDYFLWIDLPQNWREAKVLRVFSISECEKHLDFKKQVKKLESIEKKIPKYIDKAMPSGAGFIINGWYIDVGDSKVRFLGEDGKEFLVNMKQTRRADVSRIYPENEANEIVGFEAVCKEKVSNRIRVCFKSGEKEQCEIIRLKESFVEKVWKKMKSAYAKTRIYYRQFGIRATIERIIDKITGRDTITYAKFFKRQYPTEAMLKNQEECVFAYQPKISIIIPLYRTPINYLNELVESIKAQTYSNWELCLSDGSGEESPLVNVLKKYESDDDRIRIVYNKQKLQISENTNEALKIATGDYIAFADHDDLLMPNALFECVKELNKDLSIDMIYTDEDKVDMTGREHFMPHFKSDFNIDMLRSTNYFCHLVIVKREVFKKAGYLNSEFDGAQDYDFVLRCVEVSTNIKHIARVLYHWRAHKDSTAENPESKDYAFKAGVRAVQAHYDRVGIKAIVQETRHKGIYRTKYILESNPLISIIIPNKDHVNDLKKCISSIEEKSSYKNYEFIIVENNSTEKETFEYYEKLEKECPRVKVVYWKGKGFNYPAINNYGVENAKGEYVLLLNNDTEIVNEECLEELLGYCMREDVGAVGARLYYEDGTIQHAGVIVGLGGVAGHAFVGCMPGDPGYFGRIEMAQDYSAVTAACMMVKKSVYKEVAGFDEAYAVAFNDVDFCLKIREAGYLIVYNPYAELNHYESKSRGYEDTEEKVQRFGSEVTLFKHRWNTFLEKGDPHYNPNLTLDKNDFSLNVQMNKIKEI